MPKRQSEPSLRLMLAATAARDELRGVAIPLLDRAYTRSLDPDVRTAAGVVAAATEALRASLKASEARHRPRRVPEPLPWRL